MSYKITKYEIKKYYNMLLAWLPILGIYKSFIPGVSIAEFCLFLCVILFVIIRVKSQFVSTLSEKIILCFAIYSFFVTILFMLIGNWYELAWFQRVLRFSFYIFCVLYISRKMFDVDIFFKNVNVVSFIIFIGIVFQYLVYYGTGRYILLYGNLLPVMDNEVLAVDFKSIFSYSAFRPSSFFTEPSHISQFLMIPLIYNLYKLENEKSKKNIVLCVISGMTILLSKSMWGYFLIAVVFCFWVLDFSKNKHSAIWYIILPIILVLGIYSLLSSSLWIETFSRLDAKNIQGSAAFAGRFMGYEDYLNLPFGRMIFGSGFGAVINNQIANSVLFILIGEGIIGISLVVIMMISFYMRVKNSWQKTLCVAFGLLLFGSNIFFSSTIIIIFSLLLFDCKSKNESSIG